MKTILFLIISAGLVVSGYSQTRNVLVGTNNAVVQPTNFWSADVTNARSGLGLGSAATNSASAFQPSSAILSNLATGNGGGLTNITATIVGTNISITNISGLQAALDGKLATNGSAAGLISFPTAVLQTNSSLSIFPEGLLRTNGSAIGLTNFPIIPVTSGGTGGTNAQTARNGIGLGTTNTLTIAGLVSQNLTIESGGGITLQAVLTNAGSFRTNIGLPWGGLTNGDAPSFRTELGLGTAATNASSAFQPSSSALTNISSGNGGSLTNLQATNLVGIIPASNISTVTLSNIGGTLPIAQGGTGATNVVSARANLGSTVVGDAVFVSTNAAAARSAIGATTIGSGIFTLANPSAITFLRVNADNTVSSLSDVNFRAAIGLGTAATNSASSFQASSANLTILAANNGANLTNIPLSGVVNALASNGNGFALTNLNASNITGIIPASNISSVTLSNLSGTLAIASGGTAATNASGARTNLGLGAFKSPDYYAELLDASGNTVLEVEDGVSLFRSINWRGTNGEIYKGDTRTNLGLGWSALTNTNAATSLLGLTTNGRVVANTGTNVLTFTNNINVNDTTITGAGLSWGTVPRIDLEQAALVDEVNAVVATWDTNSVGFSVPIDWSGPSQKSNTRANLGLSWSALTNTNAATSLLGLTTNNQVVANTTNVLTLTNGLAFSTNAALITKTNLGIGWSALTNTNAANFRTDIGLGWSALTNSNAGTGLVSVNTNGVVVSPTNFWQVAPIQTLVQDLTVVVTTQTNNATNARNLYVYSLATNVSGISNTILLPTNAATFAGDEVTVIHQGTTNTTTVIREAGSTNNLITLNRFDEAVKFIKESGKWDFYHNISYVEPIQFSGTNASNNIAATRTNLGLPLTALTNSNTTNFQAAVFQTNTAPVSGGTFGANAAWMEVNVITNGSNVSFRIPLYK